MDLNQVTIPCTSLAPSIAFYQSLGLHLIVRSEPDYARFLCSAGTSTFSLHRVDGSALPPAGSAGAWVYFEVKDVDATLAELQAKGVRVLEQPQDKPWLWREARVADPDGNVVIIYRAGEMRVNPPWRLEESK